MTATDYIAIAIAAVIAMLVVLGMIICDVRRERLRLRKMREEADAVRDRLLGGTLS